jgi:nicotinamide-nucleotide amidase
LTDLEILKKIAMLLKNKNLSIATAESCTGGLIAHTLTNISGSSEYFDRGVITYSNRSKIELLNVPKQNLKQFGAVSKQVAISMSEGIKKKSNVDIGISTTGIAGPAGGSEKKPVGLVFIAVTNNNGTIVKKFNFSGNRSQIKSSICNASLELLLEILTK